MKLVIKEIKDNGNFPNEPLSYRVSLRLEKDTILLTRQYFKVGIATGESWDDFYFNCDNYYVTTNLSYATFMTRKLDDKTYLQNKELELINKFYDKLIKTKQLTVKELISEQIRLNNKINSYGEVINFLDKYKRRDKIFKIINKI
jgi:hypothetical protein